MEIRRTFFLSLFLHVTFSALLLLSVRFQGEGAKMLGEKVIFIDLKSDADNPPAAVRKEASLKTTVVKKMQKEPSVIAEKRGHYAEIILKDSEKEVSLAKSLSIDSEETSGIAEGSDITVSNEKVGYTNSVQGGEKIFVSTKIADDKIGGPSEDDALKLISSAIERAKTYPAIARRRGLEGTVYVSFSIGVEGEPGEIRVIKSSGYKVLDEATMKAVQNAAPYPYIDGRVEVPVTYRLND